MGKYLDKFINGEVYGSGFIYVAPDGRNYVVTSRQTAEFAKSLNVEFVDDKGMKKVVEGLLPISISRDFNVAIFAFPEGINPFSYGLTFSNKIENDEIVYAAGYADYLSNMDFQFSTGVILSKDAKENEFAVSSLIQHSAYTEKEFSGGPLLVKDDSSKIGYSIVGLNFWNDNQGGLRKYSIPSKDVEFFINSAISNKNYDGSVDEVLRVSKSFMKSVSDFDLTYNDIIPFVSYKYTEEKGPELFDKILSECPSEISNEILKTFFNVSPFSGIQKALAWNIWQEFNYGDEKILMESDPVKNELNGNYSVAYKLPYKEGSVDVEWVYENNTYSIAMFKIKNIAAHRRQLKIEQNKNLNKKLPYYVAISLNTNCDFSERSELNPIPVELCIEVPNTKKDIAFVFDLGYTSYSYKDNIENTKNKSRTSYYDFDVLNMMIGMQFQYPHKLDDSSILMPYFNFGYNSSYFFYELTGETSFYMFGAKIACGVRYIHNIKENFSVFGSFGCEASLLMQNFQFMPVDYLSHGIFCGLGIAF